MAKKIQKIYFPESCRILVVSDIHANLQRLKRLLKVMEYNPYEDYLIINGDIIEKGTQNFETVLYLKNLANLYSNVHFVMGNCDYIAYKILQEHEMHDYFKIKNDSFVSEVFKQLEVDISERYYSPKEIKAVLLNEFSEEIEWLANFPYAIEAQNHIFVHAGVPKFANELLPSDFKIMLTLREFYDKGHSLEKMVIVGHYPTRNYHVTSSLDNSILIDEEKRIIAIDGANQLDEAGQLNGLLIHKNADDYQYETYAIDEFEDQVVKTSYLAEQQGIYNVVWPYEDIELIESGKHFSYCRVVGLNEIEEIPLKNEYIDLKEKKLLRYHSTEILSVKKGDRVKIVDDTCSGYVYIKKNGILGWIPKACFI